MASIGMLGAFWGEEDDGIDILGIVCAVVEVEGCSFTLGGGGQRRNGILSVLEAGEVLKTRAVERCEWLPGACHLGCHCRDVVWTIEVVECGKFESTMSLYNTTILKDNPQSIPIP